MCLVVCRLICVLVCFVVVCFFFSSRRRHTRCALVTGVQTCALPICSFQYRASGLPISVQQLRPDYLLSDATIQLYDITLLETSAQDGTAAFDAKLRNHAGYAQLQAEVAAGINVNAGVRYETAKQIGRAHV